MGLGGFFWFVVELLRKLHGRPWHDDLSAETTDDGLGLGLRLHGSLLPSLTHDHTSRPPACVCVREL